MSPENDEKFEQEQTAGKKGQARFSHITIGQTSQEPSRNPSLDDEEEVIEIGTPSAGQPGVSYESSVQSDRASELADGYLEEDAENPDYTVDDLPPMSLMQKIILLVMLVVLAIAGMWIFNYYTQMFW